MAVEVIVQPILPQIGVIEGNSVNASTLVTYSDFYSSSGNLSNRIEITGGYLYDLINVSAAGVSSLNGASGIISLIGTGSISVSTNGQTIIISGDGVSQSIDLYGLISTGSADLRYLSSGSSGYFYPISNPNQFIKSGEIIGLNSSGLATSGDLESTGTSIIGLLDNYYLVSNPEHYLKSGEITNLDTSGLATSGDLENTGTSIQNQLVNYYLISNPNQFISSGDATVQYYPLSGNPSGYLNTLSGLSIQYVLDVSGSLSLQLIETGSILDNKIDSLSGYLDTNFATINYVNLISGELDSKITAGGDGSGVLYLNSLAGTINLISSLDHFSFTNTGNNIDILNKPQSLTIYRDANDNITGVQKNVEFISIWRDSLDKITGVYYSSYFKTILYDVNDNITGVNVTNL